MLSTHDENLMFDEHAIQFKIKSYYKRQYYLSGLFQVHVHLLAVSFDFTQFRLSVCIMMLASLHRMKLLIYSVLALRRVNSGQP